MALEAQLRGAAVLWEPLAGAPIRVRSRVPYREGWGAPGLLLRPSRAGLAALPRADISLVVHVTALQSAQFYKCAGEMKGAGNSDWRASSEKLLTSSSHGQNRRGETAREAGREVRKKGG